MPFALAGPGSPPPRPDRRAGLRLEATVLLAIGLFLGAIGPFGTASEPVLARHGFWLLLIAVGGTLSIVVETGLRRWIANPWVRAIATASVVTPPITVLVFAAMIILLGHDHPLFSAVMAALIGQVFVISLFVLVLRLLARRPSRPVVETRTVIAPPLPDAEARFRTRLSARVRAARLLAVEAHDHYVLVHTDAGTELVTARFADVVEELAGAHGFRVHRSWWASGSAIKSARWKRASGTLELDNGMRIPISRSGAPLLRAAGWL